MWAIKRLIIQRMSLRAVAIANRYILNSYEYEFLLNISSEFTLKNLTELNDKLYMAARSQYVAGLIIDHTEKQLHINALLSHFALKPAIRLASNCSAYTNDPKFPVVVGHPYAGLTPAEAFAKAESDNNHWASVYGDNHYQLSIAITNKISAMIRKLESRGNLI
jgi:hypothetical protein